MSPPLPPLALQHLYALTVTARKPRIVEKLEFERYSARKKYIVAQQNYT